MVAEFVMPKLGLTMESGTIVNWLVDDGTEVRQGQPVLVIETDKVESEVEATAAGLLQRTGQVGQEYPCGATIGWLLRAGEQAPSQSSSPTSTSPAPTTVAATGVGGRLLASPNARRLAAERGVDLWTVAGTGPGGRITSEDVPLVAPVVAPVTVSEHRPGPLATAAARNLAELLGIDLRLVAPGGVDPRITREDVAAHVRGLLADRSAPTGAGATGPTPAAGPLLQEPSSVVPLRGMRGTIAARMADSLRTMAQLTLMMDVTMDGVAADRARRSATGPAPGYTDYVIAAAAKALVDHPHVNSQVTAEGVALLPTVNVGLAVALDDGLIVPVIADTPSFDLDALAVETTRLATAARNGTLTLPELEGGTFSVTSLGMFDVDGFTPIISAPNTAILGVGRLRHEAIWAGDAEGGHPERVTRLTLSLTWDHRAFDGAPAARFAQSIKQRLEGYR